MHAGINSWFMGRPTGTRVLASLGAFLIMFAIFGWVLDPAFQAASGGLLPWDMSPDKSPDVMYRHLAHYTDESRRLYKDRKSVV